MTEQKVFERFQSLFPTYVPRVCAWGRRKEANTIYLRMKDGNTFIFSLDKDGNWNFATLKYYNEKLRENGK